MEELIKKFYEEFKGLPSNEPIVRNNQLNDAFEIVVLKVLYGRQLDITFDKDHISDIAQYVIAPPDSGIDIFVEKGDGDDLAFDVIQVKNTALSENDLRMAVAAMERTINDYCKTAISINSKSCREILSNSGLTKNNKKNCQYYIVHTGDNRDFNGSKDNEHVLNITDLELLNNNTCDKVEEDTLTIAKDDEIMQFGSLTEDKNAVVCNISGHELAVLNNKYYSTELGRNILFGHNLRDSLDTKKSKSYSGMEDTIKNCPGNFWYYNNGITIVAEDVDVKKGEEDTDSKIVLKKFSIVNGAQTTSSLGLILRDAIRNRDCELEENLKKVSVIARILKVSDSETENAIAIYNNTQNPITTRDMVANNKEQKELYKRLINTTYPQIYMEIRRGATVPQKFNKLFTHRMTTNETLAQLAYAGFKSKPFTAKDKKASLFNTDYSHPEYTVNEIYHAVFNYVEPDSIDNGILFRKNKNDIDELLFVQQLYKDGKKFKKKELQARLEKNTKQYNEQDDTTDKSTLLKHIERDSNMLETIGVCMFYYVTTYFQFASQFGSDYTGKRFDYDIYYNDKNHKEKMVKDFSDFLLMETVKRLEKTAKENGKSGNINNWVRSQSCEEKYLALLTSDIGYEQYLLDGFVNLLQKYKTVDIAEESNQIS